jgi:hypothetical protein
VIRHVICGILKFRRCDGCDGSDGSRDSAHDVKVVTATATSREEISSNSIDKGQGTIAEAWLIKSFDESSDEELIQNEIHAIVSEIFTIREQSSAFNILFSKFIKKCNERKEFGSVIVLFRQGIFDDNVIKISDLFNYVWRFDFEDLQTRIRFNNLFFETLSELDFETQELVLYALKLDSERRMKAVADNFEKFEQARFMSRADYNKVVLESVCRNCDMPMYIGVDLRDYRKSVVDSYSEQTKFLSGKCPECNKDSLIVRIV